VISGHHRQCHFANGKMAMVLWIGLQELEWAPTGWVDHRPTLAAQWKEGKKVTEDICHLINIIEIYNKNYIFFSIKLRFLAFNCNYIKL